MALHLNAFSKLEVDFARRNRVDRFVTPEAMACRTDFQAFRKYVCEHDTPAHHARWAAKLNTGEDSRCLNSIGGKNTLILSPRGSAKSTFLLEWVAWQIGVQSAPPFKLPIKVLYISYSIEIAMMKSKQIQDIIASDRYNEVFPHVMPSAIWGMKQWDIDKVQADLPRLGEPYTLACAGIKGAVASRRAHLCHAPGTLISTDKGLQPIESVIQQPEVFNLLTWNEQTQKLEYGRLTGYARSYREDLVEVKTVGGVSTKCTPEHPFFVVGRGYVQAAHLQPGDRVIREYRSSNQVQDLQPVVQPSSKADQEQCWQKKFSVLQRPVYKTVSSQIHGDPMPVLQRVVQTVESNTQILLPQMSGYSYWDSIQRGEQPQFQAWRVLPLRIYANQASDPREGWEEVYELRKGRGKARRKAQRNNENLPGCSSPRRGYSQQQTRKSGDSLPELPHLAPQEACQWEKDTVSVVERISPGKVEVYDLEVEENHNYFVDSLLVRNCVFDDLVKSPEQIENPAIRERMENNWLNVIRPVMYDGARAICLGTRMRADDIYETTFTEERGWEVIEESAIVEDEETGEEASYWPELVSLDYLQFLREDDPPSFALQYQNTIPKEGQGIIHPDFIKKGCPPDLDQFDTLAISSDFSASLKEKADYTVFHLWGKLGNEYWLLDQRRGRWSGNFDKCNVLLAMLIEWDLLDTETEYSINYRSGYVTWAEEKPVILQKGYYLHFFTEHQSYQVSFAADWTSYVHNQLNLHCITCFPIHLRGDKLQRLRGVTGVMQRGQVRFNRYRNLKRTEQELIGFGSIGKDDCVDSMVLGLTGLGARPNIEIAAG